MNIPRSCLKLHNINNSSIVHTNWIYTMNAYFWITNLVLDILFLDGAMRYQGLYSLGRRMSYRKISWSLEAARLDVIIIVSLRNLIGISAALLSRSLSNSRAIRKVQTRISGPQHFTRSCGKTSVRLVNRGPESSRNAFIFHKICLW